MGMTQKTLRGTDVVVSAHRRSAQPMIAGEDDTYEISLSDDDLDQVVTELVGVDVSSVAPYLSAFASGFGGGGNQQSQQQQQAAQAAKEERDRLEKEKEQAEARARNTLWAVLGIVGVGVLGTAIYFAARRK